MNLEHLSRLRQAIYRLGAAGFSPPTQELLAACRGATEMLDSLGLFDYSFGPAVANATTSLAEADLDELSAAFVSLFEVGVSGAPCPPQESSHLANSRTGEVAQIQSELQRIYLRFGLRLDAGSTDMVDHISTELHVMSTLCGQEADRHTSSRPFDRVVRYEDEFLTEHLLRWAPAFTAMVRSADRHPAHNALADGVAAFLAHERQLLPLLVATSVELSA